jgi:hypothetical protein
MGKTIERMRSNPRADWQISDIVMLVQLLDEEGTT